VVAADDTPRRINPIGQWLRVGGFGSVEWICAKEGPAVTADIDAAVLRKRFVDDLCEEGRLWSPRWIEAFGSVPREWFVPRFTVADGDELVERDLDHPDALEAVYSDAPLVTQWDAGGTATSSSSAPGLMATMLEHLDARPGHRVLEIGTGTGYNAALLCHALGSDAVTSVDLDEPLAVQAADRLRELGFTPRIVVADGRVGAAERGPFDRIIATCGFHRVPGAWENQIADGGVVVVPLGGGLVVLRAGPDGLCGRMVGPAAFMSRNSADEIGLRGRDVFQAVQPLPAADRVVKGLDRDTFFEPGFAVLRTLLIPTLHPVLQEEDGGTTYFLRDPVRDVSTRAEVRGETASVSARGGDLWEEILDVEQRWRVHGCPEIDRFGMTVRPGGSHELWLDEPGVVVAAFPRRSSVDIPVSRR
jgi:protein-L-isoaspartate(D-aspartate) O-methyltransferase